MFTGIIETTGTVEAIEKNGANVSYWIASSLSGELKVDQSVSHDGVCLTVEAVENNRHRITAIEETIAKTNLSAWQENRQVNIERCMQMNGRIDGHLVQGHVDATAFCIDIEVKEGSHEYRFQFPAEFSHLVIEKGSVCLNGISLTVFDIKFNSFKVAIIPYTYEHTNMQHVHKGSVVNIEFDVIGKYLARFREVFGRPVVSPPYNNAAEA
ncbi:riboflavin synthase [Parafilimonas sp.]|uniref:riboflavin synthase n=1 Tax=Parafilimonas sp. TaxID=1969739 RepID=UPI0039E6F088